ESDSYTGEKFVSGGLFDLEGRVAIVTGTSRGLGQYMARALAKAGADLVLTIRDTQRLASFEAEIKALGRRSVSLELARGMIARGYGRIINIGSVTSVAGYAGLGPYGASRGGIKQLTMCLADDWGKHGVTVNCLAPGWFCTDQNKIMYENKEWVEYLCDRIPVKRPGQPQDLAAAVV